MPITRKGTLNSMAARAENGVIRGLILSGEVVAQRARGKAPRRKGRLKRSLAAGKPYHKRPRTWAVDVGTNVEYAAAQELGSGLYSEVGPKRKIRITPKSGKALAFEWAGMQETMRGAGNLKAVKLKRKTKAQGKFTFLSFFAHVDSPGVHPHPYLRPALRESKNVIVAILVKSVVGAIRGG